MEDGVAKPHCGGMLGQGTVWCSEAVDGEWVRVRLLIEEELSMLGVSWWP